MSKKLFVGSLPFAYSDDQLRALFAAIGPVLTAKMVWDVKKNRSRGFGFVSMINDADSDAAIEKLNGSKIGEKPIWVTEARPKAEKTEDETPRERPSFRGPARPSFRPEGGRGGGPPRRPGSSFRDARPGSRPKEGGGDRWKQPSRGYGFQDRSAAPGDRPARPGAPDPNRRPFGRPPYPASGGGRPGERRPGERPSFGSGPRRDSGRSPRPFSKFTGRPAAGGASGPRRPFKKGLKRGPSGPRQGA